MCWCASNRIVPHYLLSPLCPLSMVINILVPLLYVLHTRHTHSINQTNLSKCVSNGMRHVLAQEERRQVQIRQTCAGIERTQSQGR